MPNKKQVIDLLQSKGLLFPQTKEEVEQFELFNPTGDEKPADWEAPEEILKRGIQKLQKLEITDTKELGSDIQELRMVARKGSNLPQDVIDKMKAKHKNND
ncbi:MAG: hypothetical protein EOO90_23610 [Pedobacter sp.]|nr:MAG: hypothetical protein EOO90_23610 [Pedobacter sp.]